MNDSSGTTQAHPHRMGLTDGRIHHPRLPIYATRPESFPDSWAKLLEGGARQIYPGHGKSFPVERIRVPS